MVHVPTATPVTTPAVLIVAIEVLPLIHVPPDVASVKVLVPPTVVVVMPPIAAGAGLTVIILEEKQPPTA
jgi:hypothetical protein